MVARILSKFLLSFKVVGETKRILDTFRVFHRGTEPEVVNV